MRRGPTLALALLLAACASGGAVRDPWPASENGIFGVPPGAIGSQFLYRVQIQDEGGRSSLRLVLRLWKPERFELAASDSFGSPLWRLVIHDSDGIWIEGGEASCRLDPDRPLRWPRLSLVLPPIEVPALLLGRLPGAPGPAGDPGIGSGQEVLDASGRRWSVTRDEDGVALWSQGEGESRLEWRRRPGGGRLELGEGGIRIDWRESAREPVPGTAPALPVGARSVSECVLEELP